MNSIKTNSMRKSRVATDLLPSRIISVLSVYVVVTAVVVLTGCSSVDAGDQKELASSYDPTIKKRAPQLKPDYPCQNLHVKAPSCPSR